MPHKGWTVKKIGPKPRKGKFRFKRSGKALVLGRVSGGKFHAFEVIKRNKP